MVQCKASDHTMNGYKYNAVFHLCRTKGEIKFSLLFDPKRNLKLSIDWDPVV